jgi:uncharacterized repeat protein (TIGR01451 family)
MPLCTPFRRWSRRWSLETLEHRWALSASAQTDDDTPSVHVTAAAIAETAAIPVLEARRESGPRRPLARPFEPQLRVDRPNRTRTVRQIHPAAALAEIAAAQVAPAQFAPAPTAPVGDFNNDAKVDRTDAAILAANFGRTDAALADGDLTGDNQVGLADLAALRFGSGEFTITAPLGTSNDTTPEVVWTASPGAVRYDAWIDSAPGCTGDAVVQSATGITDTQAAFAELADGTYHICVRAFDDFDNATDATNNDVIVTISTTPPGSLTVELTANRTSVSTAGTLVTYTYTVRNAGESSLSNVTIADTLALSPVRQADNPGDNDNSLEAGEAWRYTANYTVTQTTLNTGLDLTNLATADSDESDPATDDAIVYNLFGLPNFAAGDVQIRPINHASFVMTYNGVTVYVDPVGSSSLYTGIPKADLILITHDHGDHLSSSTISAVADGETRIITSQDVYNNDSRFSAWRSIATIIGYGQTAELFGIHVEAVHAYNNNHPLGEGNGYIITIGGQRIYASGDTGPVDEIRVLADIDVAFLCMNTPFTMNVDQAASVIRDMQPEIVIPYHYRNQDNTFADLARFKSLVGNDLGVAVRLLDWY